MPVISAHWLIVRHNILIKNLVAKIHQDGQQYVRLVVKTSDEDDKLIAALKNELIEQTHKQKSERIRYL